MLKTTLVNKKNKIKDSYFKKISLIKTQNIEKEEILIEKETYSAYLDLKNFLLTKNIDIGIIKGFITVEEQQEKYEKSIIKYGINYTDKNIDKPKESEHHTGLAIDISIKIGNKYLKENAEFLKEETIFYEIHEVLKEYGFILRYPKEKESITEKRYEPQHIRYVGKFIAKIISEKNYTLEEYLQEFSGILLVNKKANMTSFDVVNKISKLFGIKKVGHTGTLDPLAEGVLIITIGKATKVAELITAAYKEYEAGVLLGIKTNTLDITGVITDSKPIPKNIELEKILNSFKKTYLQQVPLYSAVKVNGKKLYEYARENKEITPPKKEVTIKEIALLSVDNDTFLFKCLVSKGCYIRSLIDDIGKSLNTYATMTTLKRTKQGKISLEQTNTLQEIETNNYKIYQIDEILDYPTVTVDKNIAEKIKNGQKLKDDWNIKDKVIFKDNTKKVLGIYEKKDQLKVWKNFV